jgi:hypothetical protein
LFHYECVLGIVGISAPEAASDVAIKKFRALELRLFVRRADKGHTYLTIQHKINEGGTMFDTMG